MKLMKIMVRMESFVFGRDVIYFDSPATLLILDIISTFLWNFVSVIIFLNINIISLSFNHEKFLKTFIINLIHKL